MADYDLSQVDIDPFGSGIDGLRSPNDLLSAAGATWDWLKGAPGRFTQAQAEDLAAQEAWRQQSGSTDPLGLTAPDGSLSPRANQGIAIMGGLAGGGLPESPVPNLGRLVPTPARAPGELPSPQAEAAPQAPRPTVDSAHAQALAIPPHINPVPVDHDPFIVYHGSRHVFEAAPNNPLGAFQDTAIGSGEGAQAYGVGHYVAQNPSIAEYYRTAGADEAPASVTYDGKTIQLDDLSGIPADMRRGILAYHKNNGNVSTAIQALRDNADSVTPTPYSMLKRNQDYRGLPSDDDTMAGIVAQDAASMEKEKQRYTSTADWLGQNSHLLSLTNPGNLYKVEFNANPDHLLDWDVPFSQQHPEVQAKLQAAGLDPQNASKDWTGESIYKRAGYKAFMDAHDASDPAALAGDTNSSMLASKVLQDAGIPGIKYADASSRSNNLWNQSLIAQHQDQISRLESESAALQAKHQNQIDNPDPDEQPWMQDNRRLSIDDIQQHITRLQGRIKELSQDDKTRNLVVFDPKHLNIIGRTGERWDPTAVDHDPFAEPQPQGTPSP